MDEAKKGNKVGYELSYQEGGDLMDEAREVERILAMEYVHDDNSHAHKSI